MGDPEVWTKPHPSEAMTLARQVEDVDFQRYGGMYADTFWIETTADLVPLDGATWADWDGLRLVFVRAGCLYAGEIHHDTLAERLH